MYFPKSLTDDRYNPGATLVHTDSKQEAIGIVRDLAIGGRASTITVLFVSEDDKPPRGICGWRKGASDTVRDLQPEDVKKYLEEFTAARWWDN